MHAGNIKDLKVSAQDLHAERERLVRDREQALANLHAITGAIQFADRLIANMTRLDPPRDSEPNPLAGPS